MKIVFVGGGTGGHIFPIKSLIQRLHKINSEDYQRISLSLYWIGEKDSLEQKVAEELEVEFYPILSGKIRRYLTPISILQNFLDLFKIIIGFFQSLYFLYKNKIDVIFCKGGYVAIPVVLAGAVLRKKIFVHESDIIPGLTNKIAAKFTKKVFWGFYLKGEIDVGRESEEVGREILFEDNKISEESLKNIRRVDSVNKEVKKFFKILGNSYKILGGDKKVVSIGQILSNELIEGLHKINLEDCHNISYEKSLLNILVIGGSQGAKAIFDILLNIARKNLYRFEKKRRKIMIDEKFKFFIILGTKNKGYKYNFTGFENVEIFEFINQKEMGELLWLADRSITRGGATSLAEQDLFGIKKIIIPLPFTAHNHQRWNGMWYKIFRGDILLMQDESLEKSLEDILLKGRLRNKEKVDLMDVRNKLDLPFRILIENLLYKLGMDKSLYLEKLKDKLLST